MRVRARGSAPCGWAACPRGCHRAQQWRLWQCRWWAAAGPLTGPGGSPPGQIAALGMADRAVRGKRVNRQANAWMGHPGCCRAAGLAGDQLGPTDGQPGVLLLLRLVPQQPQHTISRINKGGTPGWSAARAPGSPCSSAVASPGACRLWGEAEREPGCMNSGGQGGERSSRECLPLCCPHGPDFPCEPCGPPAYTTTNSARHGAWAEAGLAERSPAEELFLLAAAAAASSAVGLAIGVAQVHVRLHLGAALQL